MQLHILFPFKPSPWGGANQFLLALRQEFKRRDSYQDSTHKSDAIITNLNPTNLLPLLKQVSQIKSRHPDKIIIARIDGPISLIRGRDDKLDRLLFSFVNMFADSVIYQSHWSKEANNKIVHTKSPYETVIHNAADPKIFYSDAITKRVAPRPRRATGLPVEASAKAGPAIKTKLIATSWSPNIRKGFNVYQYLDNHLDFSRYDMTFVGNSPITFKNIKHIKPIPSPRLANLLRQHDIYVTASQNDPCSNALIEALSCGLPAVALNSGGHPELVGQGGELFSSHKDIEQKINLVAQNLISYQEKLSRFSIAEASNQYISFAKQIYHDVQRGRYRPKHTNLLTKIKTCKIQALYHL